MCVKERERVDVCVRLLVHGTLLDKGESLACQIISPFNKNGLFL